MAINDDIIERYIRLKYPQRPIREDITIQDVAEVVLMLAQEVTDLKRRIQQLEEGNDNSSHPYRNSQNPI